MSDYYRLSRIAEQLKKDYPKGTRIVLLDMGDDPRPIESGTRGTVRSVDDMAMVHCDFDNGRYFGIVYGEDRYRKLTEQEIEEELSDYVIIWQRLDKGKASRIALVDSNVNPSDEKCWDEVVNFLIKALSDFVPVMSKSRYRDAIIDIK